MRCLTLVALLALALPARAADDLTVLTADVNDAPTRKLLYNFLLGEAKKHFDARRQTVAALKTPDEVRARQEQLRARFIEALGGFPAKTPLNGRVVGRLERDGYQVEKVVYESRPQHHVTATLYIPEGKPPFPGVLVPCGHSANGKAAEAYQRACILMVKNGLAVLCYDPIGQGERIQLLNAQGKPAVPGSTSEHTMVGVGALLTGSSTATYRIWDGIRSLDYLASRPEVDPQRLGCTGNSGGGTLTAYLMALDDRIVAAAPSCYITSLERLFATIGPQDAEQNITGQVAFGMEHADYVALRAPKPTLICVGTQDFFDITGAWTTFREAKQVYGVLGHGERVDLFEFNDKHGFSKPRREAAMRWLRRWLLQKDDAPSEGDFTIFKDEELQCTRSGQVLEDFKGKSAFDFNAERERDLAQKRATFLDGHRKEDILKEVRRLIALPETITPASRKPAGAVPGRTVAVGKLLFETEPGVLVPALDFQPNRRRSDRLPLIVHVDGAGKAAQAGPDGVLEKLAREGNRVLSLDLRGFGETAPGVTPPSRTDHFGPDSKEAFLGLHLNRPLLGQRVLDLLAVLQSLPQTDTAEGIHLIGSGTAVPVALHAAALTPAVKRLTLEQGVVSWSVVARTPISRRQLANAVPGALRSYDLPDLAALLAPASVTVRAATAADGTAVTQEVLDREYARCRSAFAKNNAEKNLVLEAAR
jgi:cephalosporin-C deacetylase-like acetyl esterase